MFSDFLINPFLATLFSAAIASLLGSFVLWKKLVYFGDAMSHSTLLAVMLGAFVGIETSWALLVFAIIFAFLVANLQQKKFVQSNVAVMVVAYFCVSLALILKEVLNHNVDFASYIFGDVLLAGSLEVQTIGVVLVLVIAFLAFFFKKSLLVVIDEDLAQIAKFNPKILNLTFLCLLALSIAAMTKAVGILLMTALLILPASIARIFAKSPQQMVLFSLGIGVIIAILSFLAANYFDIAIAPMMIFIFCLLFLVSSLIKQTN